MTIERLVDDQPDALAEHAEWLASVDSLIAVRGPDEAARILDEVAGRAGSSCATTQSRSSGGTATTRTIER